MTTANYINIALISAPLLVLLVLISIGSSDKSTNVICYFVAGVSGLTLYFLDEGHPHIPGSGFMLVGTELLLSFIVVSISLKIRNLYRARHDST